MTERRLFARIKVTIPLRFLNPSNGRECEAETVDISAGGIGFITKEEVTKNTSLEMWLILPNHHEPVHIIGDVIWSKSLDNNTDKRVGVRLKEEKLLDLAYALSSGNTDKYKKGR